MEDRYVIGVDIGEDDSKCVSTLFDGVEYRPIAVCDSINFGDSVQRSGYVGVDVGELSFGAEVVPYSHDALCRLFGWDYVLPLINYYEGLFVSRKRRKTTYRTIRRDCAKRNRHK